MADMPYKAVTLPTLWQILWILYNYQLTSTPSTALVQSTNSQSATDQSTNSQQIPQSVDEILAAIKGEEMRNHTLTENKWASFALGRNIT